MEGNFQPKADVKFFGIWAIKFSRSVDYPIKAH